MTDRPVASLELTPRATDAAMWIAEDANGAALAYEDVHNPTSGSLEH